MITQLFISNDWVSNGIFAAYAEYGITINSDRLANLIEQVKTSQKVDVALNGIVDHRDLPAYDFAGYTIQVRCQRFYIDFLTNGHPEDFRFMYIPGLKLVCLFDEDGLTGFVMRLLNENEEAG